MTQIAPGPVYAISPPRGLSIASMVLGLVSLLFGFAFVVPIVGLAVGISGLKREPAGRGFAITGICLNAIVLVSVAVIAVFVIATTIGGAAFVLPLLGERN